MRENIEVQLHVEIRGPPARISIDKPLPNLYGATMFINRMKNVEKIEKVR
jgi:hypothetical protein